MEQTLYITEVEQEAHNLTNMVRRRAMHCRTEPRLSHHGTPYYLVVVEATAWEQAKAVRVHMYGS